MTCCTTLKLSKMADDVRQPSFIWNILANSLPHDQTIYKN